MFALQADSEQLRTLKFSYISFFDKCENILLSRLHYKVFCQNVSWLQSSNSMEKNETF